MKRKSLWYRISGRPKNSTDLIDYASKHNAEVNITTQRSGGDFGWVETEVILHCKEFSAVGGTVKIDSDYTEEFDCLEEASELAKKLSTEHRVKVGTINSKPVRQATIEATQRRETINGLGLANRNYTEEDVQIALKSIRYFDDPYT